MVWLSVGTVIWVAIAAPSSVLVGWAIQLGDDGRAVPVDCRMPVPRPHPPVDQDPLAGAERSPGLT
jgi:hypothetical protein